MKNEKLKRTLLLLIALLMMLQPVGLAASEAIIEPVAAPEKTGPPLQGPPEGEGVTIAPMDPKPSTEGEESVPALPVVENTKGEGSENAPEPVAPPEIPSIKEEPVKEEPIKPAPPEEEIPAVLPQGEEKEETPPEEPVNLFVTIKGDIPEAMAEEGRILVTRDGETVVEAPFSGRELDIRDLERDIYTVTVAYRTIEGEEAEGKLTADLRDKKTKDFRKTLSTDLLVTEEKDEIHIDPLFPEEITLEGEDTGKAAVLEMETTLKGKNLVFEVREKTKELEEPFHLLFTLPGQEEKKVTAEREEDSPWKATLSIPLRNLEEGTYEMKASREEILPETETFTQRHWKIDLRENPEKERETANLILRFTGELREKYLPSASITLKKDGEEILTTGITDLTPVTLRNLPKDRYDVEFSYVNDVGTTVAATTETNLNVDEDEVEEILSTKLFVKGGDEYYVSPLYKKGMELRDETGTLLATFDLLVTRKEGKDLQVKVTEHTKRDRGFTLSVKEGEEPVATTKAGLDFRTEDPESPYHGDLTLSLKEGLRTLTMEKDGHTLDLPLSFSLYRGEDSRTIGEGKEEPDPVKEWKKEQVDFQENPNLLALQGEKGYRLSEDEVCEECQAPDSEKVFTFESDASPIQPMMNGLRSGGAGALNLEQSSTPNGMRLITDVTLEEKGNQLEWIIRVHNEVDKFIKDNWIIGINGGTNIAIQGIFAGYYDVNDYDPPSPATKQSNGNYTTVFKTGNNGRNNEYDDMKFKVITDKPEGLDSYKLNLKIGKGNGNGEFTTGGRAASVDITLTATPPAPVTGAVNVSSMYSDNNPDDLSATYTLTGNGVYESLPGDGLFNDIEAGTYTLTTTPPAGYRVVGDSSQTVVVTAGQTADVSFYFQPLPSRKINIRTKDTKEAAVDTTVTITGNGINRTVTTQGGSASLSVEPGTYQVTTTVPVGYNIHGTSQVEQMVTVTADADGTATFIFEKIPQDPTKGSLTVNVVDTYGNLLGAEISIQRMGYPIATLNQSGTVYDLLPTDYIVEVNLSEPEKYDLAENSSNPQVGTVTAGQNTVLTFTYERKTQLPQVPWKFKVSERPQGRSMATTQTQGTSSFISVNMRDSMLQSLSRGNAVEGVSVQLYDSSGELRAGLTDSTGEVTIDGGFVTGQSYEVIVNKEGRMMTSSRETYRGADTVTPLYLGEEIQDPVNPPGGNSGWTVTPNVTSESAFTVGDISVEEEGDRLRWTIPITVGGNSNNSNHVTNFQWDTPTGEYSEIVNNTIEVNDLGTFTVRLGSDRNLYVKRAMISGNTYTYTFLSEKTSPETKIMLDIFVSNSVNSFEPNAGRTATLDLTATKPVPGSVGISLPGFYGLGQGVFEFNGVPKVVNFVNGGETKVDVSPGTYNIKMVSLPTGYMLKPGSSEILTGIEVQSLGTTGVEFPVVGANGKEHWQFELVDSDTNRIIKNGSVTIDRITVSDENADGILDFNELLLTPGKNYTVTANAPGHVEKTVEVAFVPSKTIRIELEQVASKERTFNVTVKGNDGALLPDATIEIIDDNGDVKRGTTDEQGKVKIKGFFTPKETYDIRVTAVPPGYYIPDETTTPKLTYVTSLGNAMESDANEVVVDKMETNPGELRITTNVTEGPVTVAIYKLGPNQEEIPMYNSLEIPTTQEITAENFEDDNYYKVKVLSAPAGYTPGAETTFQFDAQKPNLKINLVKNKPGEGEAGKITIRIHEDTPTGPVSNRLDGKTLTFKAEGNNQDITATLAGGTAVGNRSLIPGVVYTLQRDSLQLPEGYKLVTDSDTISISRGTERVIKDWVITKNTATLFLEVSPPAGHELPQGLTFNLIEEGTSNVVYRDVPVKRGVTVLENVPQGKTYNIIYNEETVPENWTHENQLRVPFTIAENEIETRVKDQFGYNDPQAAYSTVSVKVVDNAGVGVPGYTFVLKNGDATVFSGGKEVLLTTDDKGVAYFKMNRKLDPGNYVLKNTDHPEEYSPVTLDPVKITEEQFNIAATATVGKATPGTAYVDVRLLDPHGAPLGSRKIHLFKVKKDGSGSPVELTGDQRQMITDGEGRTYFKPLPVESDYEYFFTLDGEETIYELTEESKAKRTFTENNSYQVVLNTKVKSGYGQIKVITKDKDENPAPVNFQILDENGEPIVLYPGKKPGPGFDPKVGRTGSDGVFITEYLPEGNYTVELLPNETVWEELTDAERKKTVTVTEEPPRVEAEFNNLERKYYEVGGAAGSIAVGGTVEEGASNWTVTITKFSNEDAPGALGSKRGVINTIRFPKSELLNPNDVKLTITNSRTGEVLEDATINGRFYLDGEEYRLVDDRSKDKNSDEMIYTYTFKANPVPKPASTLNSYEGYVKKDNKGKKPYLDGNNVPMDPNEKSTGYSVIGETRILSDNSREKIYPVDAGMKLEARDTNVNMTVTGSGSVDTDLSINWTYDIKTEVSPNAIDGFFMVKISLPEGELQDPINDNTIVELIDKETGENLPVTPRFDPETNGYYVKIPAERGKSGNYQIKVKTFGKQDKVPDEYYKQKVEAAFFKPGAPLDDPEKTMEPFEALAPRRAISPGVVKEELSQGSCDNYKTFRIYQEGTISGDGTRIFWTIRATNVGASGGYQSTTFPIDLTFHKGAGLGEIENVQINANATGFPYIDPGSFQEPYNDDNDKIPGDLKVVLANRNVPGGRAHPLDNDHARNGSKLYKGAFINDSDKWQHKDYLLKYLPYIYYTGEGKIVKPSVAEGDQKFQPNFQRVNRGDFVEVSFETPITDFLQAGTAEGYQMTTKLNTYEYGGVMTDYEGARHSCRDGNDTFSISLNDRPYVANTKSCYMYTPYGEVQLSGQYNEDGTAIEWILDTRPLKINNADLSPKRTMNIELEFVDDNNEPVTSLETIGLSKTADEFVPLDITNIVLKEDSIKAERNSTKHTFKLNFTQMEHMGQFKFVTPLVPGQKKEDYRLKITGSVTKDDAGTRDFLDDEGNVLKDENGIPLQGMKTYDLRTKGSYSKTCYSTVEGTVQRIKVRKKWTNILENQDLPSATFEVFRSDMDGKTERITTFTVGEKENTGGEQPYQGYTRKKEGEFYVAQGAFEIPNDTKTPGSEEYYYFDSFDDRGRPYTYTVKEMPNEEYKSDKQALTSNESEVLFNNVLSKAFQQEEDPTKYTDPNVDEKGKYPVDYRQDGPDIRNAKTFLDETAVDAETHKPGENKGEPYKIGYEDSKVGKSGQQTTVPGLFDMKLTIEGYSSGYQVNGLDVVFVMDNSGTMSFPIGLEDKINYSKTIQYKNSKTRKIDEMSREVKKATDVLLDLNEPGSQSPNIRVGLVNFGTDVYPVDNPSTSYPGLLDGQTVSRQRETGTLIYAKPVVELTTSREELLPGIPVDPRSIDNAYTNGSWWLPKNVEGQTNVQAGIRHGIETLYPASEPNSNRKKVLVVVTDGAPSAHYKMKNSTRPIDDNYIVSNATYWFMPEGMSSIAYDTEDGVHIDNNGTPTIKEMDYWKAQHPDLEVITLSMDPQAGNDYATPEVQIAFLKQISSNPQTHHFTANDTRAFQQAMEDIESKITKATAKTIMHGEVTDPMGKMVKFHDINNDGAVTLGNLAPGSDPDGTGNFELTDGDVYVYDNKGTHLDKDGNVVHDAGTKEALTLYRDIDVWSKRDRRKGSILRQVDILTHPEKGILFYREKGKDWKRSGPFGEKCLLVSFDTMGPNGSTVWYNGRFLTNRYIHEGAERNTLYLVDSANVGEDAGEAFNPGNKVPTEAEFDTILQPGKDTLLYGVGLEGTMSEGANPEIQGFKLTGLIEGSEDLVTALYKVNLKTEDSGFRGNFYYEANQKTTLQPRPLTEKEKALQLQGKLPKKRLEDSKIERFFPIPSVKGPHKPLSVRKIWAREVEIDKVTYKVKFAFKENGEMYFGFVGSDGKLLPENQWPDYDETTLKNQLSAGISDLTVTMNLYQYKSTAPYNAALDPPSTPDLGSKVLLRDSIVLDSSNHFQMKMEDLLAYDNEGYEFFYQLEEDTKSVPEDYNLIWIEDKYIRPDGTEVSVFEARPTEAEPGQNRTLVSEALKFVYTKNEGSRFRGTVEGQSAVDNVIPVSEFTNIKDSKQEIGFIIKKVEKDFENPNKPNNEKNPLAGAVFKLTKTKDENGQPITEDGVTKKTGPLGTLEFSKLTIGEYKLEEVEPPTGYAELGKTYKVVVRDGGTEGFGIAGTTLKIAIYRENGTLIQPAEDLNQYTGDSNVLPILLVENMKINLPSTGGLGFTPGSVIVGLMLLVLCGYVFKVNKEEEYEM